MEPTLRVRTPAVVAEIIDGEAVIMDLASGHYFSTRGVGAEIWRDIEQGRTCAAIVRALLERYDAPSAVVEPAVRTFVAELRERALIEEVAAPEATNDNGHPGTDAERRAAFTAPVLDAYTDLEEMLLLDPIHDVDQAGWPMPKAPDAGS